MDFYKQMLLLVKGKGDKKVISTLEDENLLCLNTNRIMLIHLAARYGKKNLLQYLLKHGCDVDAQDLFGRTPLMKAIKGRHIVIMHILLDAGANIFIQNHKKESVLHKFFAQHKLTSVFCREFLRKSRKKFSSSEQMAKLMIDAGCNFYQAAFSKNVKIIEYAFSQGLPVDSVHPLNKTTALHVAIMLGDIKSLKILLKYGLDIQALDIDGYNSLTYVYRYDVEHTAKKIEILQIILNLGVSPMSLTPSGTFQIRPILMKGSFEAVRVILQSSINFTARDSCGRSLLHYLAANANSNIVEELKMYINKFDINEIDGLGSSPLHAAVLHRSVEMVRFLLDLGAKTNSVDNIYNYTPLCYGYLKTRSVHEKFNNQNVELLLQNNADPQFIVTTKNGNQITIFDLGLELGDLTGVKLAIAHLAIIENLGTSISQIILTKINSHQKLSKYYNRCKRILSKNVDKSLSVLNILTASDGKMSKYLRNRNLALKLKRIAYKQKIKSSFPYYWNFLSKQFSKGMKYRSLENKAAGVIKKFFAGSLHDMTLIVNEIIKLLDTQDLQKLCQLEN